MADAFLDNMMMDFDSFEGKLTDYRHLRLCPDIETVISNLAREHVAHLHTIKLTNVAFREDTKLFLDGMPALQSLTLKNVGGVTEFRLKEAPALTELHLEQLRDCRSCVVQTCPVLESWTCRLPQARVIRLDELKADKALKRFDCLGVGQGKRVVVLTEELWLKPEFVFLKPRDQVDEGYENSTTLSLPDDKFSDSSVIQGIEFWEMYNLYHQTFGAMVTELTKVHKKLNKDSTKNRTTVFKPKCIVCNKENTNGGSVFKQCVQEDRLVVTGRCGLEGSTAYKFNFSLTLPAGESVMAPHSEAELQKKQAKRKRDELRQKALGKSLRSDGGELQVEENYMKAKRESMQTDREFQDKIAEMVSKVKLHIEGLVKELRVKSRDPSMRDLADQVEVQIYEANLSLTARSVGYRTYGPRGLACTLPVPYLHTTEKFKAGVVDGEFGFNVPKRNNRGTRTAKARRRNDADSEDEETDSIGAESDDNDD